MHHWIGAIMMLLGAASVVGIFIVNTDMPIATGPIPFVVACAVCFIGLLVWSF